jgi:hypothetical protein
MPRSNASNKAKGCQAWKDMMLFREEHPEEFERSYHKRSNAQSTNASLKGKYGEFLRSRRWPMQKREAGLSDRPQHQATHPVQDKTGDEVIGRSLFVPSPFTPTTAR